MLIIAYNKDSYSTFNSNMISFFMCSFTLHLFSTGNVSYLNRIHVVLLLKNLYFVEKYFSKL